MMRYPRSDSPQSRANAGAPHAAPASRGQPGVCAEPAIFEKYVFNEPAVTLLSSSLVERCELSAAAIAVPRTDRGREAEQDSSLRHFELSGTLGGGDPRETPRSHAGLVLARQAVVTNLLSLDFSSES
jgi:hypothetical protein